MSARSSVDGIRKKSDSKKYAHNAFIIIPSDSSADLFRFGYLIHHLLSKELPAEAFLTLLGKL